MHHAELGYTLIQAAFRNAQIGPHHFAGSTGYGHGDLGRAALDKVAAAPLRRAIWWLVEILQHQQDGRCIRPESCPHRHMHLCASAPAERMRWQRALSAQVMAEVMGAEEALVRCQLVSGTHAIATALFACLRPGDRLLAVAGRCREPCSSPEAHCHCAIEDQRKEVSSACILVSLGSAAIILQIIGLECPMII